MVTYTAIAACTYGMILQFITNSYLPCRRRLIMLELGYWNPDLEGLSKWRGAKVGFLR